MPRLVAPADCLNSPALWQFPFAVAPDRRQARIQNFCFPPLPLPARPCLPLPLVVEASSRALSVPENSMLQRPTIRDAISKTTMTMYDQLKICGGQSAARACVRRPMLIGPLPRNSVHPVNSVCFFRVSASRNPAKLFLKNFYVTRRGCARRGAAWRDQNANQPPRSDGHFQTACYTGESGRLRSL